MRKTNRALVAGASLCALAVAAPWLAAHHTEQGIRAEMARAGFSAGAIDVSLQGKVIVSDIARHEDGARLTIDRAEYRTSLAGLLSPAQAQASGYTIDGITTQYGSSTIEIPKILIEGSTVGKDDLGKLFALDAGLPDRLKGLSAKSVSIPQMKVTVKIPDSGDDLVYDTRNIVADNIVNGKIARISVAGTTYSMTHKNSRQRGEILKSELTGVDLVQSARVYFSTAAANEAPAPLYDSYTGDGMRSEVEDKAAVNMEMGRFSSAQVRARPMTSASLASTVLEFMTLADKAKTSGDKSVKDPAAMSRLFGTLAEMMEMFQDDGMSVENMRVQVGDKAKPDALLSIAKVEGSYGGGKVPAGFRMTNLDVKADQATAKLASMSVEGFSYLPMFRGMADAARAGDMEFKNTDPRKLMPKLGTTTVRGLEIDAPDPNSPKGIKPERILVKVAGVVIAALDQVNGIPTDIKFAIDNAAIKLPENSPDKAIQEMKALGFTNIDMSARLGVKWNEKTKELAIPEIMVSGVNMGTARVSGVIGNIGRDIFEGDMATAQVALMGATAKSLNLQIENTGLAEKVLAVQARQQNRKPDDLRKEMGQMAALGIPAILGPSDESKAIGGAVAKFITQLKTLKIDLKAKNPGGIGLPDIVTVGTPDKALGLVNVSASAN